MISRIVSFSILLLTLSSAAARSETWQVDAMADKSPWTLIGQRVSFSLGDARLEVAKTPLRPGQGAVLKLTCDFNERAWTGIQWQGGPLPGRPSRLSFWCHGDRGAHKLLARFEDAAGCVYQAALGTIDFDGWREIFVPMDPRQWTPVRRKGDLESPVRWPVSLREIRVEKANPKANRPIVAFSQLNAEGNPSALDRVRVRLACDAPAHVFYEGQPVRLRAQIENPGAEPVAGQLEAVANDWLGRARRWPLGALRLAAKETRQDTYEIPVQRLGSYTVWLRLVAPSGVAEGRARIAVSRRRAPTPLDPRSPMGMGLYLPRFRDDAQLDLAVALAREAGVKWTRCDVLVSQCQPEPGRWVWDPVLWTQSPPGHAVELSPHLRWKVADTDALNRPCATGELTIAMRLQLGALDYPSQWPSLVSKSAGNPRQWNLFWRTKTRQLGLSLGDGKTRWSDSLADKSDWQTGRWYDVVVSHRRADRSVQWWIDGRRAGSSEVPFAETLVHLPVEMTIGGGVKGWLDDLAIYDRWLEPGMLGAAGPVARWKFDEGQGLELRDCSGNQNHIHVEPWRYDRIFARTRAEGISTYGILAGTPKWMTAKPAEDKDRPGLMMPRLAEWSAAVEKIVARQKQAGIRTWEVWNEPNIKAFWSPEPKAEEYASLLEATYKAVKRADPGALVLGCTLAGPSGPKWRRPYEFVEEVLNRGGGRFMDAISIHPYRQPRSPEESGYREDLQTISDMTAKYGRRLPIWITEIGWPTDPAGSSESRSAQMLVRSYLLAIAHGVEQVSWYDYRDDGTDPSYNEHHFGVLYHDMTPKPSYFAFRTMATELAGLRFERQVAAGDKTSILVFGDGRRHAAVAWSHRGSRQLAFLIADRRQVEVVDLMGNATTVKVADGALLAAIDETPVFLRGVPASLAALPPIQASPAVLKVLPGEEGTLRVTLTNPFATPLRLSWAEHSVDLPAGGQQHVFVTRAAEAWAALVREPWRAANGIAIGVPAQVVVLEGRRAPILQFDAETSQPVELRDAAAAHATVEVTVAARVRSAGPTGTWQVLATKWEGERRDWGVFLGREKGELAFSGSFEKMAGAFHDVTSGHSLFDGRWHRVAVTYSAYDAEICFYVDGKLVERVAHDGGKLFTNQGPVRLAGGFTDGRVKPAKTMATVGQIQVWNRALSAEEIGKLGGP